MHSDNPARDTGLFDRIGMMLGGACLIHCLALPVLIALLPSFGGLLPDHHLVHVLLLAIALPVSGMALWNGWRRGRDRWVPIIGTTGLALLAAAIVASETHEIPITVAGSLLLVIAHARNWRATAP